MWTAVAIGVVSKRAEEGQAASGTTRQPVGRRVKAEKGGDRDNLGSRTGLEVYQFQSWRRRRSTGRSSAST